MEGNPLDQVSGVVFKKITVTSNEPTLKTRYKGVKTEKVTVNGKPMAIE